MGVTQCRVHTANNEFTESVDPHAISDLIPNQDNVVWLDIQDPGLGDFELLRREFGFHELALEDVAKRHQRAKLDQYDGYYFVVFYAVRPESMHEINLFIGENYLVTVHHGELQEIADTARRWRSNAGKMERGVGLLVYSLLDAVVDAYFPFVDSIAERADDIEQAIFKSGSSHDSLAEVFALKKELLTVRRILSPQRDVLNVLVRRDQPIFGTEAVAYFQDVYDHTIRVLENVDLYRDQLSSALDAYLTVASNRLNEVLKRMTAMATILMSVTLIASIYGMNFQLRPFPTDSEVGFAFAVGFMLVIAGGLFWQFKRADWL